MPDAHGDDVLVNMSVWQDVDSLHDYVYRSAHNHVMAKRRQWFQHMSDAYTVLWWIPAGHAPTLAEAQQRLDTLRRDGPSAAAFSFKQRFHPQ